MLRRTSVYVQMSVLGKNQCFHPSWLMLQKWRPAARCQQGSCWLFVHETSWANQRQGATTFKPW